MKYRYIYIICVSLVMVGCQTKPRPLMIAAAANMQYALAELTNDFESQSGIATEVAVSSSGKLTAQILEGAPYDVFLSADMRYPNTLHRAGRTTTAPIIYAYGKLALWSMTLDTIKTPGVLADASVRNIALANPDIAPYGRAAMEYLSGLNVADELKSKFVFGESVAQTNQFITTGAAQIGFTSQSTAMAPEINQKGVWFIPESNTYSPIAQGAVVISSENVHAAEAFLDYLKRARAQEILQRFGYTPSGETH